jgi:hypothetical protein
MTQLAQPSGAEDQVRSPTGCPEKNFENSAHAEPAAVFGGHWGIRTSGAFRLQPNRRRAVFF